MTDETQTFGEQGRFDDTRFMIIGTGNELSQHDLIGLIDASGDHDDGHGHKVVVAFEGNTSDELFGEGGYLLEQLRGTANMEGLEMTVRVYSTVTSDGKHPSPTKELDLGTQGEGGWDVTINIITKEVFAAAPNESLVDATAKELLS